MSSGQKRRIGDEGLSGERTPIQGYGRGTRTRGKRLNGVGVAVLAALVFACVFVRVIALDTDPPAWLSWSAGIATDEGFYTLDARHLTLFGAWAPGNFHDRLISPLLSVLQQAVFHFTGPGLVPARALSVASGLLTLAIFWLALWRGFGKRVALYGLMFLGLAPPFVFYNRMALQETPATFWIVLAFCLTVYAATSSDKKWIWLAGAGLCAAIAVLVKTVAIIALPALLIAAIAASRRKRPAGDNTRANSGREQPSDMNRSVTDGLGQAASLVETANDRRQCLVLSGAALAGMGLVFGIWGVAWYAPHHQELTRMAVYYGGHQYRPHTLTSLGLNIRRAFIGGERGVFPYLLVQMPVALCLAAGALWPRRKWTAAELLLVAWLCGGALFCCVSSYAPSRYYVLFLPALAGLAAITAARMRPRAQIGAACLCIFVSGAWFSDAWSHQQRSLPTASGLLARALPDRSILIGDFAPVLCLGTPFAAAPVQPGLANDDHPVERLRATHIAVTRAPVWEAWWRAHYPEIVRQENYVGTVSLGAAKSYTVDIYSVTPQDEPNKRLAKRGGENIDDP